MSFLRLHMIRQIIMIQLQQIGWDRITDQTKGTQTDVFFRHNCLVGRRESLYLDHAWPLMYFTLYIVACISDNFLMTAFEAHCIFIGKSKQWGHLEEIEQNKRTYNFPL